MKKILFIDRNLHFNGGGEKVAIQMANQFASDGNNVTILSLDTRHNNDTYQISDNVNVDYLNIPETRYISNFIIIFKLIYYFCKHKFDFVFGIGTNVNCYLGFVAKLFREIQFIGCEHNSFDIVRGLWGYLRKISYPRLSATVVLTMTDLPKMKKINVNTFVIPNSISSHNKRADINKKRFLAIGRFSYQKSFDQLIEIFEKFTKSDDEWTLSIIGNGEDWDKINELVKEKNLQKRIELVHFTHNIENYYKESSIYLMTSQFEGLPLVLLEAQSYGIPIISYDCDTGPRDIIINNENGFLISDRNSTEFINKMILLTSDLDLRLKMSNNSIRNIIKFSPEIIFNKWYTLMNIIEKKHK